MFLFKILERFEVGLAKGHTARTGMSYFLNIRIVGDHAEPFALGLGNDHPVKGIAMVQCNSLTRPDQVVKNLVPLRKWSNPL